jgi:hypothetical protein
VNKRLALGKMTSRILLALLPRTRWQFVVIAGVLVLVVAVGAWGAWHFHAEAGLHDAEKALERHEYDEARRLLARYLQARPNAGRGHFLAACAARRLQRYDEAEEHLHACATTRTPSRSNEP